ncbi:MAG: tRNA threonylcarbamoyladenosine biosynthesis protein TsaB [Bacteroidia bacterium]|jgi:tRNA threonylcarbamoyladenosine biosynthesis protein TsaB
MAYILCIESSSLWCSVAVFEDKLCLIKKETNEEHQHASLLTVYIQECLSAINLRFDQLSAIAISAGPGSYTGLRIGTSVAKGLCYSLNLPLIAVNTLKSMANGFVRSKHFASFELIFSLIDARRNEVYYQGFHSNLTEVTDALPHILTIESFAKHLHRGKCVFIGNGALKTSETITHPNARFIDDASFYTSENLGILAYEKFMLGQFEDSAYFEPNYLKPFFTTAKKVQNRII